MAETALEIIGEETIRADRWTVWNALNDPDVLKACFPGCKSLERKGETSLFAIIEFGPGPFRQRFKATIKFADIDPPNGYRLAVGRRGSAELTLEEPEEGVTILTYRAHADLGGRMARFGKRFLKSAARRLVATFFSRFRDRIGETATS